jgi:hypothetical protein
MHAFKVVRNARFIANSLRCGGFSRRAHSGDPLRGPPTPAELASAVDELNAEMNAVFGGAPASDFQSSSSRDPFGGERGSARGAPLAPPPTTPTADSRAMLNALLEGQMSLQSGKAVEEEVVDP